MCLFIYISLRVRVCAAVHNKQSLTVLSHYPSEIRLLKGSTKREDSIRLCRMKRIRRENKREREKGVQLHYNFIWLSRDVRKRN